MLPTGELLIINVSHSDAQQSYRCRTYHQLTQEVIVSGNIGRIQLTGNFSVFLVSDFNLIHLFRLFTHLLLLALLRDSIDSFAIKVCLTFIYTPIRHLSLSSSVSKYTCVGCFRARSSMAVRVLYAYINVIFYDAIALVARSAREVGWHPYKFCMINRLRVYIILNT